MSETPQPHASDQLSRADLTDIENIRQAHHELRRAGDDAQLAAWARRYGYAALRALEDLQADSEAPLNG